MKNVMTRAWEIAKEGVAKFGGKVKEYFAISLKMAWAEHKAIKAEVIAIKDWFLNKNFDRNEAYTLQTASFVIMKQTEKAYQLKAVTDFGSLVFWVPKSVCLNQEQFNADFDAKMAQVSKGLDRNLKLVEEAKALGIKGIRKGMKTKTLEKKIAEFKMAN
ncbi:hypothetical protein BKM15_26025 [Pseudomonas syringae pv. syringae]|nr:hypothetical protein BKM15_26025 [Pseudomonas syringae pv. syringae]